MKDIIKCKGCKGQKRYMGMGCIEEDCKVCKGVGWVDKPKEPEKKKRTRKKKDE
jgi:RecJ-like exonuclease